jgi:hypothetical protein
MLHEKREYIVGIALAMIGPGAAGSAVQFCCKVDL